MIEEWGYPSIGIGIADTPTAGHELIMLDYRACGKQGEPQVVYVDQEDDYNITVAVDQAQVARGAPGARSSGSSRIRRFLPSPA